MSSNEPTIEKGSLQQERKSRLLDWLIAFLLFFFLSSVYYATASGITSSNDGSHYALLRTLVENRTFELRQFDDYAEGNDIAIMEDGRLFSDRPPGTALVGTLFYLAGGALPEFAQPLPSRHDDQNPRLSYVLLVPAFAGAGTAVVLYAIMRLLGLSQAAAATTVLLFALGTIHWKYSSVLFSHALSSFLVVLSVYLTFHMSIKGRGRPITYAFLGFVLGFSVLTEYSNALLILILLAYLYLTARPQTWRGLLTCFGVLILGGLLSALFLTFYNYTNFGSPLRLSYTYAVNYPWAGSFATTFNFSLAQGLKGLLLGGTGEGWCDGPCPNQGLFRLSPILLLALPGWYLFYREARREALFTALLFLGYLFLFARHRTFHGFTADGRYLTPFLGLLAIPMAYFVEWLFALRSRPFLRGALLLVVLALFLLSMGNVFLHIGASYNYDLDQQLLATLWAAPGGRSAIVGEVFRNAGNLPTLWLLETGAALLLLGIVFVLQRVRKQFMVGAG